MASSQEQADEGQSQSQPTPTQSGTGLQVDGNNASDDGRRHTDSVLSSPTPTYHPPESHSHTDTCSNPEGGTTESGPSQQPLWSPSSERQPRHGSQADPSDRVFPIRSVVSVEPPGRTSGDADYFPRMPAETPGASRRRHSRQSNPRSDADTPLKRAASIRSDSARSAASSAVSFKERRTRANAPGSRSSVQADVDRRGAGQIPLYVDEASDDEASEAAGEPLDNQSRSSIGRETPSAAGDTAVDALMTTRFKHVTTEEGHLVITGRDGTLQRCEDEPIHTPGAVQGFGLLLAIREESDGCFSVRYASENSKRFLGYTPKELFRQENFLDILTEEQADNMLDHIDFIRDEDADPAVNGPEVFSMSVRPPRKRCIKLWCAIHIHPAHPELIICEFELDDDHEYPLRPETEHTPDLPQDTLQSNPTLEELTESTEITSKPLRVLRSARKRRGEAGAMQVFDIMSQVQEQLASATSLDSFLKILVGVVKELTGFHRVMIYQFDSTFNGKVVTELVDPSHTRDLYKGLHFPASDIPKQARDLYKVNKVR